MVRPVRVLLLGCLTILPSCRTFHVAEPEDTCVHARRHVVEFKTGYLPLENCSLYYEVEGEGPALVLVHGAGPHAIFHPTFSRLAAGSTVVYYDQYGYGLTRVRGDRQSTTAQDVEHLEALRARLGFEEMSLLAISFGGPTAIAYSLEYPHRVSRLVLLSAIADNDDRVPMAQEMVTRILFDEGLARKWDAIGKDGSLDERERTIRKWLVTPGTHHRSPIPRHVLAVWYDCGVFSELSKNQSLRSSREGHWLEDLKRIPIPALVICGRHDAITPLEHCRKIATNLPAGRLVVFESSGHLAYLEEQERFLETIAGFLHDCR